MNVLAGETVLRLAPALTHAYDDSSAALRVGGRVLRYEGGATVLLRRLLPLVDGERQLDAVIDELGGGRLRPAVLNLCDRLLRDGILVNTDDPRPTSTSQQLDRMLRGIPAETGATDVTTLRVVGSEPEVTAVARVAPEHWQVRAADLAELLDQPGEADACTLVWVTDPHDDLLAEWNESAWHNRVPWLPIGHFDGEVAVVGPYIQPRETPCFECYRRRRAARSSLGERFLDLRPAGDNPLGSTALTTLLASIAITLVQDWVGRQNPHLPGAVRTVTLRDGLRVDAEYVLRVPRCGACRPTSEIARPILWSEDFPPRDDR